MAMTADERKKALGRGAATRIATRHGRHPGHVSQVFNCEKTGRRDAVVEVAAARMLRRKRFEVFPPLTGAA